MTELDTLPDGVAVVRDCSSCIQYHGTQSAFIAAGIAKPEWFDGLGTLTRQVVTDEHGNFTMMQRGAGNWATNERRRYGAYSIKRLQNGLIEVAVYRKPEEAAARRERDLAAHRELFAHRKLAAHQATIEVAAPPQRSAAGALDAVIPPDIRDRLVQLTPSQQGWVIAKMTFAIEDAEARFPSERQRQISVRRSLIRLAWQNPSQPQMRTPGATHPAIVLDGASRKPA